MTAGTTSTAGSRSPYEWRPLTESDAQAFIALNDAICDADGNDERADEDGFRFLLTYPLHVPGHDGFQGVFDGERMVAFAWVQRRNGAEPAHWMRAGGGVHPGHRGRGLGTQLLRWEEDTALRIHECCFPEQPLELGVGVPEGNQGQRDLLENEGYAVDRWFFTMRRHEGVPVADAADVVAPAGLEFESYRDEVDEALLLTYNEVFVDHWQFTPSMAPTWEHKFRRNGHFRADLSFLLRDAKTGRIAGYLMASASGGGNAAKAAGAFDVHFDQIGTRREFRGRGVASALITRAVAQSVELGFRTASLGVDAENPSGALGVYERNGFVCVRRRIAYAKRLTD